MRDALIMSGNLFIDIFAAGVGTGFAEAVNPTEFTFSPPTADRKELRSYMPDTFGQVLATKALTGDAAKVKFTFNLLPRALWDLIWMGDSATYTQAAGSAVAFSITAKLGKWVELGNGDRQLSALTVTTPVSMVEGVDYEVDYRRGMLRAIPGGGIADDATVSGTYDKVAVSGVSVDAGKYPARTGRLLVSGQNEYTTRQCEIECYEVEMTVSEFSPIGDDYVSVAVDGVCVTPTGQTAPAKFTEWEA